MKPILRHVLVAALAMTLAGLTQAVEVEPRLPSTADLPQATGDLPCAMSYLRILVWGDAYDSYAWLSADGKSLAYESSDHSEQGSSGRTTRVNLYSLKTGDIWQIPGANGYYVSRVGGWSPDQSYLLWSSANDWDDGLRGRLGIANRSGRSRCLLQASQVRALLPRHPIDATKRDRLNIELSGEWAHDGRALLWIAQDHDQAPSASVFGLITLDGAIRWSFHWSRLARLMHTSKMIDLKSVEWSPDGSQVLALFEVQPPPKAARERGDQNGWPGVLIVDRHGNHPRWRMLPDGLLRVEQLHWNPDGTRLLIQRYAAGGERSLDVYDLKTLQRQRVIASGCAVRWSDNDTVIWREDLYDQRLSTKSSLWPSLNVRTGKQRPVLETGPDYGDGAQLLSPTQAVVYSRRPYSPEISRSERGYRDKPTDLYLVSLITWERRLLQAGAGRYTIGASSDGSLLAWLPNAGPPNWASGSLHVLEVATGRQVTVQVGAGLQPGPYMQWARRGNRLLLSTGDGRLLLLDFEMAHER